MRRLLTIILLVFAGRALGAPHPFTVMVYNVDNLVGVDGRTNSEDYLPKRYSRAHLLTKMNNIVRIAQQYDEGRGPDIILFQEFERDFHPEKYVFDHEGMLSRYADARIEDMLGDQFTSDVAKIPIEGLLLKTFVDRGLTGYRVASADDATLPDGRRYVTHLNVIFTRFPIGLIQTYPIPGAPAMMELQVEVEGYPFYLFNVDWAPNPLSREAEELRIKAATLLRVRLDEIFAVNPNADVLIGGDFNSFYDQKYRFPWSRMALHDILNVRGDEMLLRNSNAYLYNLWYELPAAERGSEIFSEGWGTFMQMIVSRGLYDFRGIQYVDNSFSIGAFPGLNVTEEGRPFAWSFQGIGRGFSSHFPLSARFLTVRNNRIDQFIRLTPRHE